MIAIADTYSAIRMRRSYKEPKNYEQANALMQEVAGRQLDSELVELFAAIPEGEVEACYPERVAY